MARLLCLLAYNVRIKGSTCFNVKAFLGQAEIKNTQYHMFPDHFIAKTIGSLFLNPTKLTCCFLSFMSVCITTASVSPAQVSGFLPLCCSFSVDSNTVQKDNLSDLQNQDKNTFHKLKAHRLFFCLKLALCYV